MVKVFFINQLCAEIGCTTEDYNKESNSWFFTRGSASVEVFMTSYETSVKTIRTFILFVFLLLLCGSSFGQIFRFTIKPDTYRKLDGRLLLLLSNNNNAEPRF